MSKVTIVSCFYLLPKSKHTIHQYIDWLRTFLQNVDTPIVMFGEGEMLSAMRQMREEAGLQSRFLAIEKPFNELKFSSPEWIEIWNKQVELSEYKHLHNQELYRVWANKSFFVKEAIEKNPFGSDNFVWCDAGCWRDPFSAQICGPSWPVVQKVIPGRLHIVAMSPIDPWLEKVANLPSDTNHKSFVELVPTSNVLTVGGTILIGDKAAWQSWFPIFEKTLEYFIELDRFAGDDQAVITSAALWLYKINSPNKPIFFKAPPHSGFLALNGRPFGDNWFCFQQHFSRINFTLETY